MKIRNVNKFIERHVKALENPADVNDKNVSKWISHVKLREFGNENNLRSDLPAIFKPLKGRVISLCNDLCVGYCAKCSCEAGPRCGHKN